MQKNKYTANILPCVLLGLLWFASASLVYANKSHNHVVHDNSVCNANQRIVKRALMQLDSIKLSTSSYVPSDSLANPYYVSLVCKPSLYAQVLNRLFSLTDCKPNTNGVLSGSELEILKHTDYALVQGCLAQPQIALPDSVHQPVANIEEQPEPPELMLSEHYDSSPSDKLPLPAGDGNYGIVVRKPNFWNFKTNFSLQFTQSYVSDNWYKGGESHNALLAATVIEANYNNQRKLTFDNKLEMKLGFQTSHNDEKHKYKTNSDLLRLTNKLGLRAVKHWYYTIMLQSWTQFYKGYKANDEKVYSDFMSPFESLLSLGMDYQQSTRNGRFKVNATLSPLALKLKYVGRPSLIKDFGVSSGKHHSKWEYGSNVTVNYAWNIVKNVSWSGRIYFFTDYSSTQLEWENTFNLSINRYLSARVFLFPRFDDSRKRSEGQSNFEFNELLSLGLNVNF